MNKQIVFGLDPSLSSFAACRLRGDDYRLKTFTAGAVAKTVIGRIKRYRNHVSTVVEWMTRECPVSKDAGDIPVILTEGYSYGSATQAGPACECGALLREKLHRIGWLIAEVAPTTLKKFVVGGKADKRKMAVAAYKRWNVDFDTDDEVDAFGLAQIGRYVASGEKAPTTKMQEVVELVRVNWQAEVDAFDPVF